MEAFTKDQQQGAPDVDSGYLSENISKNQSSSDMSSSANPAAKGSEDSGIIVETSSRLNNERWKDIYKQDDNGDTMLHVILATVDDRTKTHGILLDLLRATPHPDLLEITNHWGQTALHVACEHEDIQAVRTLICAGAVANRADSMLFTPVHIAASKGNLPLLKAIIDPITGQEVSDLGLTCYGVTPILPRTKLSEMSALCSRGMTPLHFAVNSGNIQLLEQILPMTAQLNCREMLEGRTALHLAADLRRTDMVICLLNNGFPLNDKDYGGKTALARILEQREIDSTSLELEELISVLRQYGAEEPEIDEDDWEAECQHDDEEEEDEIENHEVFMDHREVTCF